jgi:hypothetical protein
MIIPACPVSDSDTCWCFEAGAVATGALGRIHSMRSRRRESTVGCATRYRETYFFRAAVMLKCGRASFRFKWWR